MGVEIGGTCAARFTGVREAFAANFDAGREVGASFAVTLDGEPVVDLWAGTADAAGTRPWERDTIVNVFSTTKAMTATCVHMLVDRGLLDVDAPVAHYWPEFAAAGKSALPVRYLLSHTAGLPGLRTRLPAEALFDWERMTAALAAEAPWWEPGTANGYHAMTYGYLAGELVRRVTGTTPGAFFHAEVARPLGADFHIGLPSSEDGRVAEMIAPAGGEAAPVPFDRDSLAARVLSNPPLRPEYANRLDWRRAEIPAANGHGNARSVARVLSVLACGGALDGVTLLRETTLRRAIVQQAYAKDLVLGRKFRWGLGFMLTSPDLPFGPNEHIFGHGGWGGSLGFADLDARVSWAYVMNKMSPGTTGDSRAAHMIGALYGALAA
jgi:CubicO group peptidase (beta-lactamase class C family)